MTILILFFVFFLISAKKKSIGFNKLSFCFFYFSYILRIPILIPRTPTLIPRMPTPIPHIPRIPTQLHRIPTQIPCIPTPSPCIPTPIPRILLIPFSDSPFRLLQIASACYIITSVSSKVINV